VPPRTTTPPRAAAAGKRPLPPRPSAQDKPAARALPEVPGGIIRFTEESPEDRAEKRSVLFSIDDREYTVLDNPGAELGLEYLRQARVLGPLGATDWAMETMLGADAYAALRACRGLPVRGLARVVSVVSEKLVGSLNIPKDED
jgi:hypothetical protein